MHTVAAGKSPGDRTHELREFSTITGYASRRSEELVPQVEEDAPVRVHDSKSQMPAYPDRPKLKITASWLKQRVRPNWADYRKNGISKIEYIKMEHV